MVETFTGNKGLQIEEPLIFEQGSKDLSAVDISELQIKISVWKKVNIIPFCTEDRVEFTRKIAGKLYRLTFI